jgi:hypothetical protein
MMAGPPQDLDALYRRALERDALLEARIHDLEQKVAILTVENHRFSAVIRRLTCQIEDLCQTPTPSFSQKLVDPSD